MRLALGIACLVGLGSLALAPNRASAEDFVLMSEPTSYTDVIDAFDDHDVFDLHIHVGYIRQWETGRLQREVANPGAADDRAASLMRDVGTYELQRNGLMFGLDIGIFRDLALYARLPLTLSDDRSITAGGSFDPGLLSAGGAPLFDIPTGGFRSPTRSGVDWVSVGLAWSILNQHRERWAPTWMVMVEGRFNLGEPMRACQQESAGVRCRADFDALSGSFTPSTNAGVGRGVHALRAETRASYREGLVEPFVGLGVQIEWPGSAGRLFLPAGDLTGYMNRLPPIVGRFTAGLALIPWEDRQNFQRFTFDLRFNAEYVSEGHDYSPLFDALGSSTNPYLATPNYEGVAGPGGDVSGLARTQFMGLTDTQSHGRVGAQITLEMQAAQYVRFQVGTLFMYSTAYNLTQADACNPNVASSAVTDDRLIGDCRPSSSASQTPIINPHHRGAIDMPGNRFRMTDLWQVDLFVNATAMF